MKTPSQLLPTKSIADLEKDAMAIVKYMVQTESPLIITDAGKPAAVIMDIATYEKQVHTINLARLLFQAEKDVRDGKTRPVSDFFNELRRAEKVCG